MKWQGRKGSDNVEDRRKMSAGRMGSIGGIGALAIVVIGYFLGIDVTPLLQQGGIGTESGSGGATTALTEEDIAAGQFVSVTLADTEKIWQDVFRKKFNRDYTPTTLVLFKDATSSACGTASEATGPFYCPNDKKVYLDTGFFTLMGRQFGSKGDFAAAYVVAHEVGHHVQDELGILDKVNAVRAQSSEADSNELSVRIELQADCFAGVWARAEQDKFGVLERGDLNEAADTAARIGDDTLQRNAGRRPMPDSFTHGTSEQRQRWLYTGYQSGDISACDTFKAQKL